MLNAKKDLPVRVELSNETSGCEATATTLINGEEARLRFVYVCARERFLMWPKVQYVDVHGFDDEGRPVAQRFPRTKWGKQLGPAVPLKASEDPPMNAPRCGHPKK